MDGRPAPLVRMAAGGATSQMHHMHEIWRTPAVCRARRVVQGTRKLSSRVHLCPGGGRRRRKGLGEQAISSITGAELAS